MICVIYLSVLLFSAEPTTVCEWMISHTSKVINIASMIPSHDVQLKADMVNS